MALLALVCPLSHALLLLLCPRQQHISKLAAALLLVRAYNAYLIFSVDEIYVSARTLLESNLDTRGESFVRSSARPRVRCLTYGRRLSRGLYVQLLPKFMLRRRYLYI